MDKIKDLGFAKLDLTRSRRTGQSETVFCPGKTKEQLAEILKAFQEENIPVLGTKCSREQAEFLSGEKVPVSWDPQSKILSSDWGERKVLSGSVAICTGGTADIPAAEEAAKTIEFFGAEVARYYDVGVAGLHRLLAQIDNIRKADVIIVAAGMEGALGSVIAGLTEVPVIAIPTSIGYGASFEGIAPLLAMLNSCAEGLSVVNIDNGFGAGVLACRILRMKGRNS